MDRRRFVVATTSAVTLGHGVLAHARHSMRNVSKETTANLSARRNVFVGWVDLRPGDWSVHGYGSKEEWESAITRLNHYFHRMCETKWLNDRKVSFGESATGKPAASHDLFIKFTKVGIDYNEYHLILGIEFIDPKSKAVLGAVPVRPYYGSDWGFENFLKAALEEVNRKLQVEIAGKSASK